MGLSNRNNARGMGCLALFGTPFLIGGIFFTYLYFNGYRKWFAAQYWIETPCWIETANLKVSRDDTTTYKAEATYRYVYNGQNYRSSTVSLYDGSDNVGDYHERVYKELASHAESLPGRGKDRKLKQVQAQPTPFRCFVDPHAPTNAVIYRDLRWEIQTFMAIFALTFPAIGAGLVYSSIWRIKELNQDKVLKEKFPSQPWRWKAIWSSDTIPDTSRPWQGSLDAYTLWSMIIVAPLIVTTAMTGAFAQTWYAWLLLILVALWLIPASATWRGIKKWRAIGESRLRLEKPFIEPGGVLLGKIELGRETELLGPFSVTLICEKKVTVADSEGDSTATEIVWRSNAIESTRESYTRGIPSSRIPVAIHVPNSAQESLQGEDTQYEWRLELESPPKLFASFQVPIFHSA